MLGSISVATRIPNNKLRPKNSSRANPNATSEQESSVPKVARPATMKLLIV